MYIKKVSIKNIRSIDHFEMEFEEPAGWHVIIGDNGSGKSSIVRAIGLAIIGSKNAVFTKHPIDSWLSNKKSLGRVEIKLERDKSLDTYDETLTDPENFVSSKLIFARTKNAAISKNAQEPKDIQRFPNGVIVFNTFKGNFDFRNIGETGWFSVGFGPFRRFSGGNSDQQSLFKTYPRVGAHLSLFGEDVILSEALEWIKELDYERLKEKEQSKKNGKESTITYENVLKFINNSKLLPHNAQMEGFGKDSIIFKDGKGNKVNILELSDGYRTILSLIFELIRNLVRVYGANAVFDNIKKGKMYIDLPGVVLIDEVDAHLHPSWQTQIGQWFTQYFPKLQFIVTTHSPLICRACEKGSIWRLAAPDSNEESGEITGIARKRLIYGNILDAYGTEAFGDNVSISEDAALMRNRLGELYEKSMLGLITKEERFQFEELKAILPTFEFNGTTAQ